MSSWLDRAPKGASSETVECDDPEVFTTAVKHARQDGIIPLLPSGVPSKHRLTGFGALSITANEHELLGQTFRHDGEAFSVWSRSASRGSWWALSLDVQGSFRELDTKTIREAVRAADPEPEEASVEPLC